MASLCQQQQQHGSLLPLLLDVVSQPPTEYQQHAAMHAGAPMGHPMQQSIMAPGRPHVESPAGSCRAPCAEPVTHADFRMFQSTSPGQQHGQLPGSCASQQQQPDAGQQQCQLRLLLVPHNTASRRHVADLGQPVNMSIPIAK